VASSNIPGDLSLVCLPESCRHRTGLAIPDHLAVDAGDRKDLDGRVRDEALVRAGQVMRFEPDLLGGDAVLSRQVQDQVTGDAFQYPGSRWGRTPCLTVKILRGPQLHILPFKA
jgi:hypothetical protein